MSAVDERAKAQENHHRQPHRLDDGELRFVLVEVTGANESGEVTSWRGPMRLATPDHLASAYLAMAPGG